MPSDSKSQPSQNSPKGSGEQAAREQFVAYMRKQWPDLSIYWADQDSNWCYTTNSIIDPQPYWETWQAASSRESQVVKELREGFHAYVLEVLEYLNGNYDRERLYEETLALSESRK